MSRLLELEQRESRERSPVTVEAADLETADTKAEERDKDSGCSGSLASLDDLLETQADFRVSTSVPLSPPSPARAWLAPFTWTRARINLQSHIIVGIITQLQAQGTLLWRHLDAELSIVISVGRLGPGSRDIFPQY